MGRNLSGADFSYLTIRQAYLQGMNLHHINFDSLLAIHYFALSVISTDTSESLISTQY